MALTIKLYVDKAKNKVVFAESDGAFMDAILSFLTMPMGTIVMLLNNNSHLGCFDNLRRSIEDLGEHSCFDTQLARDMLLHPVNSAAVLLGSLAVNLHTDKFYVCKRWLDHPSNSLSLLSHVRNVTCRCNQPLDVEVRPHSGQQESLFVADAKYVITDGLLVNLPSMDQYFRFFHQSGIDLGDLEVKEVTVGREELLLLLRRSLISETALTDAFLKEETSKVAPPSQVSHRRLVGSTAKNASSTESSSSISFEVKLMIDEAKNQVLSAEAETKHCFPDFLSSFLTFPLGAIVKLLGGKSSLVCVDNLYKSVQLLADSMAPIITHLQDLLSPTLPPFYRCTNQPIVIPERNPDYCRLCPTASCHPHALYHISKQCCGKCKSSLLWAEESTRIPFHRKFLKYPKFSVTDGLSIKPLSFSSFLEALKIDGGNSQALPSRVVEKTVVIGAKEAIEILQASLVSKTVFSDVFLKNRT